MRFKCNHAPCLLSEQISLEFIGLPRPGRNIRRELNPSISPPTHLQRHHHPRRHRRFSISFIIDTHLPNRYSPMHENSYGEFSFCPSFFKELPTGNVGVYLQVTTCFTERGRCEVAIFHCWIQCIPGRLVWAEVCGKGEERIRSRSLRLFSFLSPLVVEERRF